MIFFGALSGFGYVDTSDNALGAEDIVKHAINTDQQFVADLEEKLRVMKKLEAEWAAKRRTAKDVSSILVRLTRARLIPPFAFRAHG
jgi:hypothetical protein